MTVKNSQWRQTVLAVTALGLLTGGAAAQKSSPNITDLDAQPIAAGDLHEAYFHWQDQLITVAGYPALFMSPSPWQQRIEMGATPEERTPALATCEFLATPTGGENMESSIAVVVGGRFLGRSFSGREGQPPKIDLRDCELVSTGDAIPADGDPWTIDGTPIALGTLHEAVFGWQGQTVQVTGYYHGTTYSSASDTSRHDLRHDQGGGVVVGCNMAGDVAAPEAVLANRAGVIVEGTIGEPTFDQVILDDCRLVEP